MAPPLSVLQADLPLLDASAAERPAWGDAWHVGDISVENCRCLGVPTHCRRGCTRLVGALSRLEMLRSSSLGRLHARPAVLSGGSARHVMQISDM